MKLRTATSFWVLAAILGALLFASSVPSPLYVVYQDQWGFSSITLTSVFAVYAIALLAALLVVGSISDHIGRRPTLLAALAVQIAAMLAFAGADGVGWLFVRPDPPGPRDRDRDGRAQRGADRPRAAIATMARPADGRRRADERPRVRRARRRAAGRLRARPDPVRLLAARGGVRARARSRCSPIPETVAATALAAARCARRSRSRRRCGRRSSPRFPAWPRPGRSAA